MIMGPLDSLNGERYRLFQEALEITPPWFVKEVRLNQDRRRLDIILDFPKGSRFKCPECGCEYTAYDTRLREWRHLDFFQHATHIFAPLPRIECLRSPHRGSPLAMVEGYNSVPRAGRAMARGFRTVGNVILKSFLMAGKLDFDFPRNIWNPL